MYQISRRYNELKDDNSKNCEVFEKRRKEKERKRKKKKKKGKKNK